MFELPLREAVESVSFMECHQVTVRKMRMMTLILLSVVVKFQVLQVGSTESVHVSYFLILLGEEEGKNFDWLDGTLLLGTQVFFSRQFYSRLILLDLAPCHNPEGIP